MLTEFKSFRTPIGLARAAGVKYSQLLAVGSNVERNYRSVKFPKRDKSGTRTISIPSPALKRIQKVIDQLLLNQLEVSDCAHAYRRGNSILTHVSQHLNADAFIKLDIQDFFPSIGRLTVEAIFREVVDDRQFARLLAALCTLNNALPQGAPTSPTLSNLTLRGLDHELKEFSTAHKLNYSRYGDDLVLSGRSAELKLYIACKHIVEKQGFRINQKKSRFMVNPKRLILTGISISSRTMKLPKARKRELRRRAFELLKSDGFEAFFRGDRFDPFHFDRIMGQLAFWSVVEPDSEFPRHYSRLLKVKYAAG